MSGDLRQWAERQRAEYEARQRQYEESQARRLDHLMDVGVLRWTGEWRSDSVGVERKVTAVVPADEVSDPRGQAYLAESDSGQRWSHPVNPDNPQTMTDVAGFAEDEFWPDERYESPGDYIATAHAACLALLTVAQRLFPALPRPWVRVPEVVLPLLVGLLDMEIELDYDFDALLAEARAHRCLNAAPRLPDGAPRR
jgi:hypothetical protein